MRIWVQIPSTHIRAGCTLCMCKLSIGLGQEAGELQQLTVQELQIQGEVLFQMIRLTIRLCGGGVRGELSNRRCQTSSCAYHVHTHGPVHWQAHTHRVSCEVIYSCEVGANWSFCALSPHSFHLLFIASELC